MQYNKKNSIINQPSRRLSNIELLRIIAMLIIIAHHFSVHAGFEFSTDKITIPRLWIQFIQIGGKIGVNIFILISGYFLINSTEIRINKLFKLWIQMFIYSITLYMFFIVIEHKPINIKSIIKCFLPVTFGTWWFASTYFVLYILSPFINKFLTRLEHNTFQKLLITLFILWCLIPTLTNRTFESNSLLWFMFLYTISAYIRLWHNKLKVSCRTYLILALILIALTFASTIIFDILGLKISFFNTYTTYFYGMQTLPILLISFFMFLGFKELNIHYSKAINLVSSATFGVYLIHDNIYISPFLWIDLFKNAAFSNTIFIIPYSIVVIFTVFIICTCIELVRIHIFEKKYMKIVMKMEPILKNIIDKFYTLNITNKL